MLRLLAPLTLIAACGGDADCPDDDLVDAWVDADSDGFGAGEVVQVCEHDLQFVANDRDCDDTNALVSPFGDETCNAVDDDCDGRADEGLVLVPYYRDADDDGFGDADGSGLFACARPDGHVRNRSDCDDTDASANPNAEETCSGRDDDCDGLIDADDDDLDPTTLLSTYADVDGDGFGDDTTEAFLCSLPKKGAVSVGGDCDDARDTVNPDALEVCNDRDDDCDGQVDDADSSLDPKTTPDWFLDADMDGFGDPNTSVTSCQPPKSNDHRSNGLDCDDNDPGVGGPTDWMIDGDGDGYGAGGVAATDCVQPAPDQVDAALGVDCDDGDAAVNPGATEICGGGDDDCNGLADDDDPDLDLGTASPFFSDLDDDGYGDAASPLALCVQQPLTSTDDLDCDDSDPDVNPDGTEVCNGLDDDCNSLTDDADPAVDPLTFSLWYFDGDSDGVGDLLSPVATCAPPVGYVADPTDCDDTDPGVGAPSLWLEDLDDDGVGAGPISGPSCSPPGPTWAASTLEEDCDDGDPDSYPGAIEICADGIDQDCNGVDFCPLADDFELPTLDATVWEPILGDAGLTTAFAVSGAQSLNLAGGGGLVTTLPFDTSDCATLTWSFEGQRGPEAPDGGDFLFIQYWDGAAWIDAAAWEGSGNDDSGFRTLFGDIVDPAMAHSAFQFRFRSQGSGGGFDDFFVDDLLIDCF